MIPLRIFVISLIAITLLAPVYMKETHYDVLGVVRTANEKTIKKKWKELSLKYHPDKANTSEQKHAEEIIVKINKAYEVLSDPVERKKYDRELIYGPSHHDNYRGGGYYNTYSYNSYGSGGRGNGGFGYGYRDYYNGSGLFDLKSVLIGLGTSIWNLFFKSKIIEYDFSTFPGKIQIGVSLSTLSFYAFIRKVYKRII